MLFKNHIINHYSFLILFTIIIILLPICTTAASQEQNKAATADGATNAQETITVDEVRFRIPFEDYQETPAS